MMLSDLGATVINIEAPQQGDEVVYRLFRKFSWSILKSRSLFSGLSR